MKFSTKLLSLLAISTTYAHIDLIKVEQCIHDLDETYNDCYTFEDLSKESLQTVCKAFNSDRCQKLYNEGVAIAGDCKLLDLEAVTEVNVDYGMKFVQMEMICSTDENNQPCPLINYYIVDENDTLDAREAYNKYINESCKSKKCVDAYIASIKKEIELRKSTDFSPKTTFDSSKIDKPYDGATVDDEDEIAYNLAFFESQYCSSQQQTSASDTTGTTSTSNASAGNAQAENAQATNTQQGNDNKTSDATTIKTYSTIFMVLLLLFTLL